jgi:hypothetical protein
VGIYECHGAGPANLRQVNVPYIDGWLAEFDWDKIEPSQGRYNWAPIDGDIALAKRLHKKVTLLLRAGPYTPAWVYTAGAPGFRFTYGGKYRQARPAVMPPPWDPTFLKYYTRLIRAAGQRYNGEAVVGLVRISNSTRNGLEMHLPFNKAEQVQWRRMGYSHDKVIASYKTMIDTFVKAFPDKPFDLEIHPVLGTDRVAREVVAYGSQLLGKRFGVNGGWLSGKSAEDKNLRGMYSIMREYGPRGFASFTMIGNQTKQPERFAPGGLAAAINQGMAWNAHYFEVWLVDVQNRSFGRQLTELNAAVRRHYAQVNGQ